MKTNYKVIVGLALILAAGTVASAGVTTNLADLTGTPATEITYGGLRFSGFNYAANVYGDGFTNAPTGNELNDISVTFFTDTNGHVAVKFEAKNNAGWVAAGGSYAAVNANIEFKVTSAASAYYINQVGSAVTSSSSVNGGQAKLLEYVSSSNSYTNDLGKLEVAHGGQPDTLNVGNKGELFITKNINVSTFGNQAASIDTFYQTFAVGSHVPEPATMGLLAVGGLALLRRRKK